MAAEPISFFFLIYLLVCSFVYLGIFVLFLLVCSAPLHKYLFCQNCQILIRVKQEETADTD